MRNFGDGGELIVDRTEEIQVDGGFECRGLLVSVHGLNRRVGHPADLG